jgi:hypothetical protein
VKVVLDERGQNNRWQKIQTGHSDLVLFLALAPSSAVNNPAFRILSASRCSLIWKLSQIRPAIIRATSPPDW